MLLFVYTTIKVNLFLTMCFLKMRVYLDVKIFYQSGFL